MRILVLHVEAEQDHIAVLHYIILAFHADQTLFTGSGQRALLQQILVVYYFCLDEASLEIGVDLAGCLSALVPILMVHALVSSSPAVRKLIRPKI